MAKHMDDKDRGRIEYLLDCGKTITQIAKDLGRPESTISAQSSRDKRRKTIVSSTRFKNSGRNVRRSSAITAAFTAANCASALFCSSGTKPSGVPAAVMLFAPMFDVMMTAVFLKSTVRPLLSVRRPSSST